MKKLMIMVATLALLSVPALASAQLVGYWNFNSNDLPGGGFGYLADPDVFPLAADEGIGNATLSVGGGIVMDTVVNSNGDLVYQWIQSFGGSTINALFDDPSGGSFAIQGGTDTANNGAYLQLAFDMTGLSDLEISYATRGTGSGFTTQTWSWSTDGVTFTDFATIEGANASSFFLVESPVLAELDFASTAYLRLTFDGATGSTGNNRVDNLVLTAQEAVATEQHSLTQIKSLFR